MCATRRRIRSRERDVVGRRSRAHRRTDDGFVLLMVLGVILLLSIVGLAMLGLASTTASATGAYANANTHLRDIDGALETAVHEWRTDLDIVGHSCTGKTLVVRTYLMTCTDAATPWSGGVRVMDVVATLTTGTRREGAARVRVVDVVDNVRVDGYSIEICDWLLGAAEATQTLDGCLS